MTDTSQSHRCTWPNCCDELREQVAALTAERDALQSELRGVVQVIATHANQLQNYAGNLDAMPLIRKEQT